MRDNEPCVGELLGSGREAGEGRFLTAAARAVGAARASTSERLTAAYVEVCGEPTLDELHDAVAHVNQHLCAEDAFLVVGMDDCATAEGDVEVRVFAWEAGRSGQ